MSTSGINSHGNKQLLWRRAVGLMAPSVCCTVSLLASVLAPLAVLTTILSFTWPFSTAFCRSAYNPVRSLSCLAGRDGPGELCERVKRSSVQRPTAWWCIDCTLCI